MQVKWLADTTNICIVTIDLNHPEIKIMFRFFTSCDVHFLSVVGAAQGNFWLVWFRLNVALEGSSVVN